MDSNPGGQRPSGHRVPGFIKWTGIGCGGLIALLILIPFVQGFIQGVSESPSSSRSSSAPTTAPAAAPQQPRAVPKTYQVRYVISPDGGRGSASSITYATPDGGQEQVADQSGDWSVTYADVPAGTFLYVSGQNGHDFGDIGCTIEVDGRPMQSHTSSGAYVIATCSGRL